LKEGHADGSPRCDAPTLDMDWLENEVWTKIVNMLNNPDKLAEEIKQSLKKLQSRQAELSLALKPINEKLIDITNKKAKLADEWVVSNMAPDKYRDLQSSLNKEEIRLKSLRANINPSQFAELESANAVLKHWQDQFRQVLANNDSGINVLQNPKPIIKIVGLEDIELTQYMKSPILKRQVMNRLQTKIVVFHDCVEIRRQLTFESNKSINVNLTI
jgi:hypothetical protein